MFNNMRLGVKIGLGFGIITFLLIAAVGTTIWQVGRTARITTRLIDIRVPTAQASLMTLNGINHSLAALRGWIILGKDVFKEERAKAWSDEIESAMGEMKTLSVNWTDPRNIERLKVIEEKLSVFKKYQQEIEDIAQTIDNTPATKILLEQAASQGDIMAATITKMIDIEIGLEATPQRKALLGMMADVRGSTALALANIRAYLLSGDAKFKDKFDELWGKSVKRFEDLMTNAELMTSAQLDVFSAFRKARETFEPLPSKMFEIRSGAEWNLANAWLGTKAAPTAFAIKETLSELLKSQQQLMAADKVETQRCQSLLAIIEWILLGAGIVISALVGVFITRSITKPVGEMLSVVKEIASGDFTREIVVRTRDEIGVLAQTVNGMIGNLRKMIIDIKENSRTVASSSEELSSVSSQMASGSEEMSSQSRNVAGAAEQMSTNINTMASAVEEMSANISTISSSAEQTSQNMRTIASAVEEMSVSIGSVSKNAKETSKVAGQAMEMSTNATRAMNTLGEAANAIGKVTAVIKRIAEQTNLLALNATIEAASAGDAGKGFAVVANEIKELANQSAQAAEDIANKIEGVQTNTGEAIKTIGSVLGIINNINESVGLITAAIEEQTRAVNDISSNVSQANSGASSIALAIGETNKGANDVSKNVAEAAKATADVSSNIQGVNKASSENSASAHQVKVSAGDLARISASLQGLVAQFKVDAA